MTNKELVEKLREHADWAGANEWEAPITLGDDLSADETFPDGLKCGMYLPYPGTVFPDTSEDNV